MRRWLTREPVPFSQRMEGEEAAVAVGDRWGNELFDCAWFHFTATLVRNSQQPLAARIDVNGEMLVVDGQGRPLRALTNVTSEFARAHGEPGKAEYPLPLEMVATGRIDFWGDAAFNDLFGGLQGDGRIVRAEVCEVREDIRALYFDFEVLCDVLEELSEDKALCDKVSGSLEAACETLQGGLDAAAVAEARDILAPHFERSDRTDSLRVWAVGHAHLDLAWLWPIRETIRKGIRTFATAMANRELYPEHILGMSQPQLYAWIKERDPNFYEKVKRGVKEGAIEPQGRFWVEPDCNIPNGESLVRQVLYGARFFREEFGFVPSQCWQPDVFGYNGQLPQILVKSGHDAFMTQKLSWNVVNRFPHHSFHWEGIDGTSILTHMLPEETYNGPAAPKSLRKIRDEYAERDVSGHALMCFGIGDGGAGPGIEHLERLRRLRAFETLPAVEIRPTPEFFEAWRKDADKFPRWKGELYLERHQGTFTTQALTKKNNRHCEIALRELEFTSVLAETLADLPYPAGELDAFWKEVLLYQFHDILPGSSIKRVYDESNPRYSAILERIETLTGIAFEKLLGRVAAEGRWMAINALSQPREDWIERGGEWYRVRTPALGWAVLPTTPTPVTDVLEAAETFLENEFLRVEFAEDGPVASLFDKILGQETVPEGERANCLLVIPDRGDAWDFDAHLPTKDVWRYLAETPLRPSLVSSTAFVEGPNAVMKQVYSMGKSSIEQRIILPAGARMLTFETAVEWKETAHMLRVAFPTRVKADTARFEIPFGSVRRTTREDDPVAKAQLEVPAQQWIDLADKHRGLALFNDCKYGFRVKGSRMEMTLIRSVPHPSCAVITVDDTGAAGRAASPEYTDLGSHSFRYAVQPQDGRLGEAELTATARAFNAPVRVLHIPSRSSADGLSPGSFIEIDHPAIELTACKKAESGEGIVLRLCNVTGDSCRVTISHRLPYRNVSATNLLEEGLVHDEIQASPITLAFSPFEVRTILLTV